MFISVLSSVGAILRKGKKFLRNDGNPITMATSDLTSLTNQARSQHADPTDNHENLCMTQSLTHAITQSHQGQSNYKPV